MVLFHASLVIAMIRDDFDFENTGPTPQTEYCESFSRCTPPDRSNVAKFYMWSLYGNPFPLHVDVKDTDLVKASRSDQHEH